MPASALDAAVTASAAVDPCGSSSAVCDSSLCSVESRLLRSISTSPATGAALPLALYGEIDPATEAGFALTLCAETEPATEGARLTLSIETRLEREDPPRSTDIRRELLLAVTDLVISVREVISVNVVA